MHDCRFSLRYCGSCPCKKGAEAFNAAPDQYTGDGMLRAGKITSIIGIILSALGIVYYVIWIAVFGTLYSSIFASLAQ